MKKKIDVIRDENINYHEDQFFIDVISYVMNFLSIKNYEIQVVLVNKDDSAYYNGQYRNKYGPTNVLSFDDYKCGQIILCVPIIEFEAVNKQIGIDKYWAFILIHGTLHLCGFDHEYEEDALKMEQIEDQLLDEYFK